MFVCPISVYYEDTDAGGVVYHANYLKFFERARTQWLSAMGISQSELLQQDIAFVVSHADIQFQRSARFEQQLEVISSLTELKRASILFHQRLVDAHGQCYCTANIKVACVKLSRMKPFAIPSQVFQEFTRAS